MSRALRVEPFTLSSAEEVRELLKIARSWVVEQSDECLSPEGAVEQALVLKGLEGLETHVASISELVSARGSEVGDAERKQ